MRKRFGKKRRVNEEMTLQITSMADIFTILLVFLLKTFSTGVSNVSPGNISLPVAHANDEVHDHLKLELSAEAILLDDKPVATLHEFHFDEGDVEANGTSHSLNVALGRERQRKLASVSESGAAEEPRIMLLADQKTPYATIRSVLSSAGAVGFKDLKLVVVEEQ